MIAYLIIGCSVCLKLVPPDLQGSWHVAKIEIQEAGQQEWSGNAFGYPRGPIWHVDGIKIDVAYKNKQLTKWIISDPATLVYFGPKVSPTGAPTGIRFTDSDGVAYTGSYTIKDGKLLLHLGCNAPIKGENANGSKFMKIELERLKPLRKLKTTELKWFDDNDE